MPTTRRTPALRITELEHRIVPSFTRVAAAPKMPAAATVSIAAVYDTNGDGTLNKTDKIEYSSGALIDDFHVVGAAHAFLNDANEKAKWAFVWAGRTGEFARPFGEAKSTNIRICPTYLQHEEYDVGLITLDRSLGLYTGSFTYFSGDTLSWYDSPRAIPLTIRAQIRHYPGEGKFYGVDEYPKFRGVDQYLSTGLATAGLGDNSLSFDDAKVPTFKGSSGGPVYRVFRTPGGGRTYSVVGVVSREADVPARNVTLAARFDIGVVGDFLATSLASDTAPGDLPDLMNRDTWFRRRSSGGTAATAVQAGRSLAVSAPVINLGTQGAADVVVRFRLSTNGTYGVGDRLLGDVRVVAVGAMSQAKAAGRLIVPADLPAGKYYVVWSIDPDGEIAERQATFETVFADQPFNYNLGTDRNQVTVRSAAAPAGIWSAGATLAPTARLVDPTGLAAGLAPTSQRPDSRRQVPPPAPRPELPQESASPTSSPADLDDGVVALVAGTHTTAEWLAEPF